MLLDAGKAFNNKAAATHSAHAKVLKTVLGSGVGELVKLKVFFSQGLLVDSLANPHDPDCKSCVRSELGAIARNLVPRDSAHPVLLKAAEELIS